MVSPQVIHIAGFKTCGFYRRATSVLTSISVLFPSKLKIVDHEYPSRDAYRAWLLDEFRSKMSDTRAHKHSSSPFVWISNGSSPEKADPKDVESFIGGHDDSLKWCRDFCAPSDAMTKSKDSMISDGHVSDHGYDYDLIVIGGGSGGLATSKEASALGAKVALLDFVKPSPAGTSWGLGGTCVNVGCIPKKLMHNAALLKESLHLDSSGFGIAVEEKGHSWESMRENVNNYIRGLNFKYRVSLRENEVTYLNKYGRFVDKHTLELTDKKGKKTNVTASRFLIATGGRPSPLSIPGAELAISSDDIFHKEANPGKTLCIGASYISLECGGFLSAIGNDVTIAVRSILLRGFDRECAEMIGSYMANHGIKFKNKVVPTKLEKSLRGSSKIKVTFSDDSVEEYDTVLVAVGRSACTPGLGLENVDVETNPKNGKIITKLDQTSCPNVYAIGDVVEGCPELTPVAIQAGKFLAQRLFGKLNEFMDYRNVCTTVFTPIEFGTVGYSEEDAKIEFGDDNVEVYHSYFKPLEWSLSEKRSNDDAYAKIIVDKGDNERVVGIHFLGPNAGETMQGYAVAIKKGITFKDLEQTIGIHPTCAEELVSLTVTKGSGKDAKAGGC